MEHADVIHVKVKRTERIAYERIVVEHTKVVEELWPQRPSPHADRRPASTPALVTAPKPGARPDGPVLPPHGGGDDSR